MATYRQIHIKIWSSPDFQELSTQSKFTFIYLFSNSHRNESGVYRITPKTISNETDIPISETIEALKEIENIGLIKYDFEQYIVWVVNAFKYQTVSPNIIKAVYKDLEVIDHSFCDEFKAYYDGILNPYETPSEPLLNSSGTVAGKGNIKSNINNNIKSNINPPISPQGDEPPPSDPCPYGLIVNSYHEQCPDLPKVVKMPNQRKKHVRARWEGNSRSLEFFDQYFKRAGVSEFLNGSNDRLWKADFDWLMNDANMTKVLEGKYDNKDRASPNKIKNKSDAIDEYFGTG